MFTHSVFLCPRWSCGKDFVSQASLDKHSSGADPGGGPGAGPPPDHQKMRSQHQNSTKLRPQNGSFRPVTIWGPPLIKSWIRPCSLTHKSPRFRVLFAAMGFYLNTNWITTVTHILISKSDVGTPGAIGYTKSNRNIIGIIKYTPQNIRNILVTHAERNALKKKLRQTHGHTFRNPEI